MTRLILKSMLYLSKVAGGRRACAGGVQITEAPCEDPEQKQNLAG